MFHNVVRRCTAVSSWSVNQLFYSVPIGSIRHFVHVEALEIVDKPLGRQRGGHFAERLPVCLWVLHSEIMVVEG
ncbi:hypothetical protein D3C87_1654390 [compost metagenome]